MTGRRMTKFISHHAPEDLENLMRVMSDTYSFSLNATLMLRYTKLPHFPT
jgi:hypothetical protein